MKIYIDADCRCHSSPAEGLREFDVPFFEGKCPAYIEGTRYVPPGETWTRSDGKVFTGEMISPAIDSRVREAYQKQYEAMLPELEQTKSDLADADAALNTLGAEWEGE